MVSAASIWSSWLQSAKNPATLVASSLSESGYGIPKMQIPSMTDFLKLLRSRNTPDDGHRLGTTRGRLNHPPFNNTGFEK